MDPEKRLYILAILKDMATQEICDLQDAFISDEWPNEDAKIKELLAQVETTHPTVVGTLDDTYFTRELHLSHKSYQAGFELGMKIGRLLALLHGEDTESLFAPTV